MADFTRNFAQFLRGLNRGLNHLFDGTLRVYSNAENALVNYEVLF